VVYDVEGNRKSRMSPFSFPFSTQSFGLLLLICLMFGIAGTMLGMLNEFYCDPFSGVRYRGFPIASLKLPPYWESPRKWRLHVGGFVVDMVIWATPAYVVGHVLRSCQVRRLKRRLTNGLCVNCGYDLRGLPLPRCPECGEPFDQGEGLERGRQ